MTDEQHQSSAESRHEPGEKMVVIKLSRSNARLLSHSIDGWMDAGACKDGLTAQEMKALRSAFDQIMRQLCA